jgi:N-ethylmaleimide reductase
MRDSDPKRTFNYTISKLSDRKLAYLHFIEKMSGDPAITVTIEDARHWFAGTLMVNGGFDRDRASSLISSGLADLVSFGVPFIANPDLVDRFQRGAALNEPDTTTFYGGDERGYTDYPTL